MLHTYIFLFWLITSFLACTAFAAPPRSSEQRERDTGDQRLDTDDFWKKAQTEEYFLMIRHAYAPGGGDPSYFVLGDCLTQRNLSELGREQARNIGKLFVANGIAQARVFTSQWCRCKETADLLGLGKAQEAPVLNSFFQKPALRDPQTTQLREWMLKEDLTTPLVLVTHQVNITAFTGHVPASGEIVLVRRTAEGSFVFAGGKETEYNSP